MLKGGPTEPRPALFGGHVLDVHGAVLAQRVQAGPVVQIGLQRVECFHDGIGRGPRHNLPALDERDACPAGTWYEGDRAADDRCQRRPGTDFTLHFDGHSQRSGPGARR